MFLFILHFNIFENKMYFTVHLCYGLISDDFLSNRVVHKIMVHFTISGFIVLPEYGNICPILQVVVRV
jgi:hypothetical protein